MEKKCPTCDTGVYDDESFTMCPECIAWHRCLLPAAELTMRDRFAMAALNCVYRMGIQIPIENEPKDSVARAAYEVADAMLKEREVRRER